MSLNPETLESLLVDRALGELEPEVEALLTEHLAVNPGAREAAQRIDQTLDLARQAIPVAKQEMLPEPSFRARPPRLALAISSWFSAPGWRWATALAAGLVLGWCIRAVQWHGNTPVRMGQATPPARAFTSPTMPAAARVGEVPRPWLHAKSASTRREPYSVVWDSASGRPAFKENL